MDVDDDKEQSQPIEEEVYGLDDDQDDEELFTLWSFDHSERKPHVVPKKCALLSTIVVNMLAGDSTANDIELRQVNSATMTLVAKYLVYHKGEEVGELPCPVRSVKMSQIVEDQWDAEFIDSLTKKQIFEVILAANYMAIKSLLHLGCAKIATLIKALTQQEANDIIAAEKKYQEEEKKQNADVAKKDEGTGKNDDDEKKEAN